MAYDDIKISELPDIRSVENDDSLVINDATNNLTYKVDWRDLKNSIGTISNGIVFPLGDIDKPSVAIGDYSSGIYGEDYGTFHIVTQSRNRLKVNQAGTTQIYNGNIVLGNIDRACFWSLDVYNTTTFYCQVNMEGGLNMPGLNIDGNGNIITDGNLIVGGDVELGTDCDNTITIHGELVAECNLTLTGDLILDGDIIGKGDIIIEGNGQIGSGCDNTLNINAETTIECDTHIKGDLILDGNLELNGSEINIGDPNADCGTVDINLNGDVTIKCDLDVKGDSHFEGNVDIDKDLNVNGDVNIGSGGCDQGSVNIDAPTTINCDLTVDGNLNITGEGPHVIGPPSGGNTLTPCNEQADCPNGTICYAGYCYPTCDVNNPTTCIDGSCQEVTIDGNTYEICVPNPSPIDCDDAPTIELNGNVDITCDLNVGGDTTLSGDLNVDGGLTIGKPGGDCSDSPVEINGDTEIDCDLTVNGNTTLNNLIIDGNLVINPNGGNKPCDTTSDCAEGWECVDGTCIQQKCDDNRPCPGNSVCYNGRCYQECGTSPCPDGFDCTQVDIDGIAVDICVPNPDTDCDDAPTIDINSNVDIHCDLTVGGDIYYQGGVLSGGNVSLGEKCDDVVEIKGTLTNRCDVFTEGNLKVDGDVYLGSGCGATTVNITSELNVDCDATFIENVEVFKDITIRDGDLTVNGGVISGDGSGIYNLNIPGSLRFKGSYNAGDPPPGLANVGDFYLNNSGDFVSPTVESDPGWGFTSNDALGGTVGVNGRLLVALNQHMIYTVDGVWILGSIVDSSGYVTLDTEQTITQTKNFDHNVIDSSGSFDVVVPERTIELRHDYGVYARAFAINELDPIPQKP